MHDAAPAPLFAADPQPWRRTGEWPHRAWVDPAASPVPLPPGLVRGPLEVRLRTITAQRLSLLYAPTAPEFFDRSLFRSFIATLRELSLVRVDAAGKLAFGDELVTWANDSRLILSRELRHSILKITPEMAHQASLPKTSD